MRFSGVSLVSMLITKLLFAATTLSRPRGVRLQEERSGEDCSISCAGVLFTRVKEKERDPCGRVDFYSPFLPASYPVSVINGGITKRSGID